MSHSSNQTILFQGDSITDAGRNREDHGANSLSALGLGYAKFAATSVLSERPCDGLRFFNRGVSGDRVTGLLNRWRPDAINLKPDWVSILIGVNDSWSVRHGMHVPVKLYGEVYRLLLEQTREELPEVKFILCEPFALTVGGFEQAWLDELRERAAIVRDLAKQYDAAFVPFQSLFESLTAEAPAEFWLPDGVHPSAAGHLRMAKLWREVSGW